MASQVLLFPFLGLLLMGGCLSYTHTVQVRALQPQLRFSGATAAQLFRNQQVAGPNPAGSLQAVIVQAVSTGGR